jgi:hypothetical protein
LFPSIAVAAAIGAALVFGVSSVVQQPSAKHVRHQIVLLPWIVLDLVQQTLSHSAWNRRPGSALADR